MPRNPKMVYVTFECSPEFKARLEDAAKADQRSMSSQIRVMLSDWMKNVKESPWLNRAGSEPTRRSSIVERIEGPGPLHLSEHVADKAAEEKIDDRKPSRHRRQS